MARPSISSTRYTGDGRQRRICRDTATVHGVDGDTERRFLEDRAEAGLTLAQRLLDLVALDDECLVDGFLLAEDVRACLFRITDGQLADKSAQARMEAGCLIDGQLGDELFAKQRERSTQDLGRGVAEACERGADRADSAGVERLGEQRVD